VKFALLLFLAASLQAQSWKDLLLPHSQHVRGVVVDQDGAPVTDARVDHTSDRRKAHQTDSQGRFELDTQAPALVIRKPGFESVWVKTGPELRVTLRKTATPEFRSCAANGKYVGIEGWGAVFRFPMIERVKVSDQGNDIDYGARNYYIKAKKVTARIRHGSGPMWGLGTPLDTDVWRSIKYEETAYTNGREIMIDARGQLPDGTRWRNLGRFGETVSYSGADKTTAKIFDQMLDGACVVRH